MPVKSLAVVITEPRKIEIRKVDVPDPSPDEVQVRCLANGICMLEVSVYLGHEQWCPFNAGHEGVGEVVAIGKNVKNIKVGDRVPCRLWQEICNVPAEGLPVYQGGPSDPALLIWEPVDCVVRALRSYDITPGDRVLLFGAGFMGLLNVQGLAHYPLAELVVCDLDSKRLELATAFGATETLRIGTPEGDARLEALKSKPFDLVIEASGAKPALRAAGDLTRGGGRLSIFGWHHGETTVNMTPWHLKGLRVLNSAPGIATDHKVNNMERAVRLIERGIFDMSRLITHRHHFKDAETAMRLAAERRPDYIKGVLTF